MSVEGGGREVAYRLFAAEYDDASLSHAESDEERAPNYVITPTGARVNRLFVVGTLTEITQVNDEMLRARVVDPTGAFVIYAGQYQPDELAALERLEPPAFVAVTGKARTFQPDDSDRVYTSVRPESIATVDADTRDRWVVSTAEQTRERIGTYAAAAELDAAGEALTAVLLEAGVNEGLAKGIPLAQDHYGTTPTYLEALEALSVDAARVVAGDLDQVEGLGLEPDAAGGTTASFGGLATVDLESPASVTADAVAADGEATPASTATTGESTGVESDSDVESDSPSATEEATADSDLEAGTDSSADDESTAAGDSGHLDADTGDEPETADETATFDEDEVAADEAGGDDLGDFESTSDLGGEMYEMDDDEREELEEEFGAEFTTGADVDEPGNADIDVQEPEESTSETAVDDEPTAEPGDATAGAEDEVAADGADEDDLEPSSDDEAEPAGSDEPAADDEDETVDLEDVDLQSRVVETMADLDDGDGADRETVVETVANETGASEGDVEDAIEEALMGGQCYEPTDGNLKAI
ncbi:hypothetical protein [Natrononativus amylolyticus]|uniref:hypothetical protein n=1 Tax=Natrononativus amylolyticus TaxID=2963434 RepID=UPI0020CD763E|nr:hypothetical protein [Natrononativus amylolyticus]